ncbi:hypothetical protein ScPMuIL_000065 [Solemya velum]
MWPGKFTLVLISLLGISLATDSTEDENIEFRQMFREFLTPNEYIGGAAGVVVNGELKFADGHGKSRYGYPIEAKTLMPISSISKSITAIAVMKLIEEERLSLETKVFGPDGVMHQLHAWEKKGGDQRLSDITIDHLLRHTAGWDANKGPNFDPVLNEVMVMRGYNVTDISAFMKPDDHLHPFHLIRFMLTQKLDFTPGTKTVPSNLGYLILGRIIEIITDTSYTDYVKRHVLNPCGMWHTRIGPPKDQVFEKNKAENLARADPAGPIERMYEYLHPHLVDSALGWYSNVYDITRFMQCLDGSRGFTLLRPESLRRIMEKPVAAPVQHKESWVGAGFHVNTHGEIWVDGDTHSDDLILYHKGFFSNDNAKGEPTTWVILLDGQNHLHLRHMTKIMIKSIKNWPSEKLFENELADTYTESGPHTTIIKYQLDEHALSAYTNALKLMQYDIKWISGNIHEMKTHFSVIAEKSTERVYEQYIVEHGLVEKKLHLLKQHLEDQSFNLTFLQEYKSSSHDFRYVFLAIFRRNGFSNTTQMKFGIHHYTRPYQELLKLYEEKGYHPISQTMINKIKGGMVSFIFEEDLAWKEKKNFKAYVGLGERQLEKTYQSSVATGRKLTYLDSSDAFGKPRFSAVFTKHPATKWQFSLDLYEVEMRGIIMESISESMFPKIIVGYTNRKLELKFALYMESNA